MIKNVGILSPGDMGSAVGRVLKQNGFNVFANLKNRSDRTRLLSQSAGISPLDSLDDLTKTCDVILSILVPSEALSVAEKVADSIKSSCDLIYVDCNAIAPSTKKDISAIIENVGCKFVDSGIIGTPPNAAGNKPKFYVS
ncbi:MAG: NAD(P)-binding domain-containing protein, partial [Candidatus Poribacteria bacterium]|nr:NAD(P)-binding domain-containing protein [Candidatus Poribacteria bacterium]